MIKYYIVGLCFAFSALQSYGQQNQPPAMPWSTAGHMVLNVADPETTLTASWQFDRADNGDIRITKQEQHDGTQTTGTLMSVCDDRALLFKDIVPLRYHEMSELDRPILLLQLTLKLLTRALPQGPQAVVGESAIDIGDEKTAIHVHKGNIVRRDFAAPWQAHIVIKHDASDSLKFKIVFSYATGIPAKNNAIINLEGIWQQASNMPILDGIFSLKDWQVYRVNTVANIVAGNAQFDSEVMSLPLNFKTIGELRSRIERNWSKSLQARKQFTCG